MAISKEQRAVDQIVGALETATAYIHTRVHRVESPWVPEDWRNCNLGQCGVTDGAFKAAERIMKGLD
jgi:hypothetical protein